MVTKRRLYITLLCLIITSAFLASDVAGQLNYYEVCGWACVVDEWGGYCDADVDFAELRCCIYLPEYNTCGEAALCECENCQAHCPGF